MSESARKEGKAHTSEAEVTGGRARQRTKDEGRGGSAWQRRAKGTGGCAQSRVQEGQGRSRDSRGPAPGSPDCKVNPVFPPRAKALVTSLRVRPGPAQVSPPSRGMISSLPHVLPSGASESSQAERGAGGGGRRGPGMRPTASRPGLSPHAAHGHLSPKPGRPDSRGLRGSPGFGKQCYLGNMALSRDSMTVP